MHTSEVLRTVSYTHLALDRLSSTAAYGKLKMRTASA